jgi:hypothetical protein
MRISDIIARWMAFIFILYGKGTEINSGKAEGIGERQSGGVSVESLCCLLSAASFELRQLEILFLRPIL